MNPQGSRARDNQRQRLYDAQEVLFEKRVSKAALKHLVDTESAWHGKYPTVEAVRDYVNEVLNSRWFQSRWGRKQIRVEAGRGSNADHSGYSMSVSTTHRRSEIVILHEIAHCIAIQMDPYGHDAWHGPEMVGVLMALVRGQMGKESADTLTASFKKYRLRKNNKRVPSAGSQPVVTKAERAVRAKAREERDQQVAVSHLRRVAAAETIRAAVKAGYYGPSGSKPRAQALATARTMEKPGQYGHQQAMAANRTGGRR